MIWNNDLLELETVISKKNWMALQGLSNLDKSRILCVNIYAPRLLLEKKQMWSDIALFISQFHNDNILLMGDFNTVLSEDERHNSIFNEAEAAILSKLMLSCDLYDVELDNGRFTWFGAGNKKSRIDRALINGE